MEEEQKRLKEAAPKEKRETKNQIEADRLSRKETLTQKEQERLEELDNNPEVDTTPERKEEQKRKLDDFLKQEEEINKKEEIVVDKEDNLIDRPEIDRPDGRKTFTDKEGTVFVDINNDGEVSANEINDQKREQAGTEEQDQSLKEEEQRLRDLVANPPEEIILDPELFKLYLGQNEQGKALIIASLDVMKQGDDEQKKLFNEALKTAQDSAGITFRQNLRVAENALGNFIDDLNQDFGNTVERLDRQKTEIAAQMGDVDIETQQSLLQESQRLDAQRNQLASQGLGVSSFAQQTGARSGDIFRGVERQRTVQQRQLAGREAEREQSTRELQEMKTRQLREKALQAEEFFGTKRFEDIVADDPGKLGGLLGFQVGRVGGAPNITGSLEAQRRLDEQRRRQSLQEQFKLKQFNI